MRKKILVILLLISIMQMGVIWIIPEDSVKADSYRYQYTGGNIAYPGYAERINAIKSSHPNWNFIIMETGLDWNDVISAEYSGHFDSPKNLIQGKSGGWICQICGSKVYDTGNWMCASEAAIKYYMDPRNWLVDSPYLFQFLQTDYMETSDNDVYSSLNGTFLYSWENASTINRVCREKNASPYFIIARILQEQGNGGGMTYRMRDPSSGIVYYNLFNIGASGNTQDEVYNNAFNKAKQMGWDSIEKCLYGGISFLLSSYIAYKQNTLYLNKFDVETYMGTYVKQYMQNVEAPKSEALSMYNKMKNANLLDKNLTFIIPAYKNMPLVSCASPDTTGEAFPKNIRVKEGHSGIIVRAGRSTDTSVLDRIADSSVNILSVERFSDGWHKIVLENGTVGFVKFNTDYLEEVNDVTNCYEKMTITDNETILRAGPGFDQTEITILQKGDIITRIDNSGRYNFGGKTWDRVMLTDGRQGFLTRDSIKEITQTEPENNKKNETSEENVIEENNTISNNITNEAINNTTNNETNEVNETTSNETQNNIVENTTGNVIVNNPENNETFENVINEGTNGNEVNIGDSRNEINEGNITGNKVGEDIGDDTNGEERRFLIISPEKMSKDLDGIVTKNGVQTEEAGTGYKIIIEEKEYTIVKRGDVNGDGYVKANDYLIIKDYIIGNKGIELNDEYLQAADVTNDKAVKANDYLKIKDHIMYGVDI